ncbi:MAG: hypothetical protein GXP32_09620 [Kiritimatiellaeota bacterium]|nr:hypothetical protein [Kiritimatiellota bacterium]
MKKVLLAAHDAGGAEILSAWYREHVSRCDCYCCLEGPALSIFKRDHEKTLLVPRSFVDSLVVDDFILTGSSLESDLERFLIRSARIGHLRCATFLDHWDLYEARFDMSEGLMGMPTEIWVGDRHAYELATRKFSIPVKLRENPYFKYLSNCYDGLNVPIDNDILYICEPVSVRHEATLGWEEALMYDDERVILRNFFDDLTTSGFRGGVVLRLHPREYSHKYDEVLASASSSGFRVNISCDDSLLFDVKQSRVVVGVESMALVVAHVLGKRTFSYRTGRQWPLTLPFPEIVQVASTTEIVNAVNDSHAS